jgi:hypothetical protein
MNYEEMLNLKIESHDHPKDMTIRGLLKELLRTLWSEGESFSGKRPFGNSGWEFDIYLPLVKAGCVTGVIDSDGYVDSFDTKEADDLVLKIISYCFSTIHDKEGE